MHHLLEGFHKNNVVPSVVVMSFFDKGGLCVFTNRVHVGPQLKVVQRFNGFENGPAVNRVDGCCDVVDKKVKSELSIRRGSLSDRIFLPSNAVQ